MSAVWACKYIGTGGMYNGSKTEAEYFPAPGITLLPSHILLVVVDSDFITYTSKLKYLSSYVTHNLNDTFDVRNHAVQATKALNSMMPHVFHNKSFTKHVKN
eukprot:7759951-Ditylum_brightwellii.AAC.1